jgi:hypothetical protein
VELSTRHCRVERRESGHGKRLGAFSQSGHVTDARNGRNGEMYGKDTYPVGDFGTRYIETTQEKNTRGFIKVATTIKHFVYGSGSDCVDHASMFGEINRILNDLCSAVSQSHKRRPATFTHGVLSIHRRRPSVGQQVSFFKTYCAVFWVSVCEYGEDDIWEKDKRMLFLVLYMLHSLK